MAKAFNTMTKDEAVREARVGSTLKGGTWFVTRRGSKYGVIPADMYDSGRHGKVAETIDIMAERATRATQLETGCLCIIGCSVNGACPVHGDKAMPVKRKPSPVVRYRELIDKKYLSGLNMAEAEEVAELSVKLEEIYMPEHLKSAEAQAKLRAEQARYDAAMHGLANAITQAFNKGAQLHDASGVDYDTTHQIKALIGATTRLRSSVLSLLSGK